MSHHGLYERNADIIVFSAKFIGDLIGIFALQFFQKVEHVLQQEFMMVQDQTGEILEVLVEFFTVVFLSTFGSDPFVSNIFKETVETAYASLFNVSFSYSRRTFFIFRRNTSL